MTILKRRGEPG